VAEAATIYHFSIDLADMDRNVYETLELKMARHPSETIEFLVVRMLAYCLEHEDGIALTDGVCAGDEPALLIKDPTGQVTAWIEVGLPDAARLHKGSKLAGRVAVYPHRDTRQWLPSLAGERIHRRDEIRIHEFDRAALGTLINRLERRTSLALTSSHGDVHVAIGSESLPLPFVTHRI
jgi:uncharacterized protein YaeQ